MHKCVNVRCAGGGVCLRECGNGISIETCWEMLLDKSFRGRPHVYATEPRGMCVCAVHPLHPPHSHI